MTTTMIMTTGMAMITPIPTPILRIRTRQMLDDFLIRAALAGVGVALATGPLGSFVVWRRMAYFGDATSHAAILGCGAGLGHGSADCGGHAVWWRWRWR